MPAESTAAVVTTAEACEIVGVSRGTFYLLAKRSGLTAASKAFGATFGRGSKVWSREAILVLAGRRTEWEAGRKAKPKARGDERTRQASREWHREQTAKGRGQAEVARYPVLYGVLDSQDVAELERRRAKATRPEAVT